MHYFKFISEGNIFTNLGLGWFEILFHAINLVILVVALYFLLVKPVKKMVKNHKAKLDEVFQTNKKLEAESAEVKATYEKMSAELKDEAIKAAGEATLRAEKKACEIIRKAEEQAVTIADTAKKEARTEKQRLMTEYKETVSTLAVDIAGQVLKREITEKDNQKLIDEALNEWN